MIDNRSRISGMSLLLKMSKKRNLFLISLSISLIYIVLSLKGVEAGNDFLVIIGLFGFFSFFTTPILFLYFFANGRYDPSNFFKSILSETKSVEVKKKSPTQPKANPVVETNQDGQRMNNRNNARGKKRSSRKKFPRRKNS